MVAPVYIPHISGYQRETVSTVQAGHGGLLGSTREGVRGKEAVPKPFCFGGRFPKLSLRWWVSLQARGPSRSELTGSWAL
jgi:hypothetical protein